MPRLPRFQRSAAAVSVTVACALSAAASTAAHSQNAATAATPAAAAAPQLVVLITVDQLRPDYFDRWGATFTGGLARFWTQGAVFTNAAHDHATTETAPGHATIGSGRFPRHHGIVRNEAGVQDPQAPLIADGRGGGASPFRFRGSAFFDWVRARDPSARALSVSRKDRGAILPLGRARQSAFWYSPDGRFVTSNYYADTLPAWVSAFNARDFVAALDGATWNPLAPSGSYAEPDDMAVENGGRDFVFPHVLPTDRTRRAAQLTEYPVMDSLTVALALAGVQALTLGDGNSTDFLAVSLSTTDAVGHRYGPDSRELHDQVLRADRYLGQLIDSLYAMRDSSRILFALSADHGVAPFPDVHFAGTDSLRGRVDVGPVFTRARSALASAGVEGDALNFESGLVVLDTNRLRAHSVPVDSVIDALRTEFRLLPGVIRADAVPELEALAARGDRYARIWRNAIPDDMDAVLALTAAPFHYWGRGRTATHGSPHEYDARVPIMFLGPAFATGHYDAPARTVDLVATLAAALHVAPTEPIDGRALLEALVGDRNTGTPSSARARAADAVAAPVEPVDRRR